MDKEDVVNIYNGILAIKNNEILPFSTTKMYLEGVILREISQTETNTICSHLHVESKNKTK